MKSRRSTLLKLRGDQRGQKIYSLAILLKVKTNHSRITKYTTHKLMQLADTSFTLAKKLEEGLIEYGYAHFEGCNSNKVLVINSISSHTSNRNINIDEFDFSSYRKILRSLQAFIIMRLQASKDYYRHLLQSRHNPKSSEEFKKAYRKVKNFVREGLLNSVDTQFNEWGISLKRIAKEVGCCERTAQRVIKFALSREWLKKEHHVEQLYAPKVCSRPVEGYTFSTRNNLYKVHANTYSLSPAISSSLLQAWC